MLRFEHDNCFQKCSVASRLFFPNKYITQYPYESSIRFVVEQFHYRFTLLLLSEF